MQYLQYFTVVKPLWCLKKCLLTSVVKCVCVCVFALGFSLDLCSRRLKDEESVCNFSWDDDQRDSWPSVVSCGHETGKYADDKILACRNVCVCVCVCSLYLHAWMNVRRFQILKFSRFQEQKLLLTHPVKSLGFLIFNVKKSHRGCTSSKNTHKKTVILLNITVAI